MSHIPLSCIQMFYCWIVTVTIFDQNLQRRANEVNDVTTQFKVVFATLLIRHQFEFPLESVWRIMKDMNYQWMSPKQLLLSIAYSFIHFPSWRHLWTPLNYNTYKMTFVLIFQSIQDAWVERQSEGERPREEGAEERVHGEQGKVDVVVVVVEVRADLVALELLFRSGVFRSLDLRPWDSFSPACVVATQAWSIFSILFYFSCLIC